MMLKRFIALFVVLSTILSLNATPINKLKIAELGKAAFSQKRILSGEDNGNVMLKDIQFYGNHPEEPVLAILNFEDGFIVMSADDAATPVLAYALSGRIENSSMAPGVQYWLELYAQQIEWMRENGVSASKETAQAWASLTEPVIRQTKNIIVAPLITAKWNQSKYYNSYSPNDAEATADYDYKTPNGCAALAMAMMMYYYRYPIHGVGTHTNYSEYGTFTVNFAQQTYNYDAMEDALSFYNDEVAKLIFHCATALNMHYGPQGSGAIISEIPVAAKQHFGFKNTCDYRSKNHYNNEAWRQLLKGYLDDKKPVLYCGSSEDGGHAFICDGYDSNNKFHFNFGWGGAGDGYYALTASETESNPVGGFSNSQYAIIDFYPADNSYPYYCDSKIIHCSSGTLEDGSSIFDYQNNTHCSHVITENDAYRVYVDVQFLDLVGEDSLTFWDGNPQNGQRLLTLRGTTPQNASYSFLTDSLYITFDTDDSLTAQGWRLKYSVERLVSSCDIEVINNQYHGMITDGSGEKNYASNLNCRWRIRALGKTWMRFTFTEFDLSPEDELRIYNLKIMPKELLATYTGSTIPDSVTFESNYVEVSFVSDNCKSGDGFTLYWTTEDEDTTSSSVENRDAPLLIYPNPAQDFLNVSLPASSNWNISILDFSGRIIRTAIHSNTENVRLPLGDLANGIYFVTCQEREKIIKRKFIVQH